MEGGRGKVDEIQGLCVPFISSLRVWTWVEVKEGKGREEWKGKGGGKGREEREERERWKKMEERREGFFFF